MNEKKNDEKVDGLFKRCPGYAHNFKTLIAAVENGDISMLACVDKATGKDVAVICAVVRCPNDQFEFVPVAKLFDGNPYDELLPPE
jgi:hypothetical protein